MPLPASPISTQSNYLNFIIILLSFEIPCFRTCSFVWSFIVSNINFINTLCWGLRVIWWNLICLAYTRPIRWPSILIIGEPELPPIAGIVYIAASLYSPEYIPLNSGTIPSLVKPAGAAILNASSPISGPSFDKTRAGPKRPHTWPDKYRFCHRILEFQRYI